MKFLSDILARAGLVVDGTVTLNSVANATTDTDRFIVVDSGVVKYRTGTQLLSDIGGISGNQTITLSGDATGSGTTSIAVTLANSGVTAGTYGSSTAVPVITVDAKGRVTGVTTASISGSLTFTGDVTGSGTTGSTTTLTLANSGVAAGTYNNVTVNAKGLVTSGSNVSYLTSYTETDTLASVTGRGAATSTVVTFSGGDGNNSSLKLAGYNQRGGAGYHGFLEATNTFGSATNPSKYFRLDSVGSLQIVNNAYTVAILTLTDAGALSVPGSVTAGSFVRSGGTSSQFLKADGSVDSTTYQSTSQKGQANGYASLDGAGKVPIAQLPSSIMEYKGTWNASTNSPSLADGTGDTGDVYRVSTAGTRNLGSGSITFDVGDYVIYNGTIWEKSDTTDAVASVNGFTGVITLTTTNIAEGTNLYYTDARARAALSFAAGSGAYNSSTGVITIPTNTNQLTNGAGFITSSALSPYLLLAGGNMTGNIAFGSSGAGLTWAANTDGASITFESTGDGASGGRALSNLLIALTDNGDEGLKVTTTGTELLYVNTNQFQYKGNTIWHSGNDGSGSGLDADLLDGISSASFLRSDVVDATVTGTILSTNNANVDGANFEVDTTNKTVNEYAYKVSRSGSAVGGILIDGRGVFASGTTVNGSTVWHQGNLTNLNQLTNGPGYLTAESDTLATVVSRGNATSNSIRVKRPSNKVDNNGNPIEFGGRVEFNNDFVSGQSGYIVFRYPTYNNFLIGGDYDGNIGGGIPNIQFGRANGSVYMHIAAGDGTGNIGINTTSPSAKLHVEGTFINNGTTGDVAYISSTFATAATNGRVLHIRDNKAAVGTDSYVSVGWTSSPGQDVYIGKRTTSSAGFLAIQNSSATELFTINLSSGNAGIQVSNPANKFQIGSVGSTGYGGNDLVIGNGTQVMAFYQSSSVSTWYTNTNFSLMPSGTGSTGNLGVGVTSPSYRVDIGGSLRLTGALVLDDTTSNVIQHRAGNDVNTLVTVGHGGFDHNGYLRIGGANVATQTWVQSQGYITPNSTVSGWIAFQASTQGTPIIKAVQQDSSNGYYLFQGVTGSTEVYRVDRFGNTNLGGSLYLTGTSSNNIYLGQASGTGVNIPAIYSYSANGTYYWSRYVDNTGLLYWVYNATVRMQLGLTGNLTISGTLTENSSVRWKENIQDLSGSLDKVEKLRGVTYNKKGETSTEIGLIAEEVEEVYPEFVEYDEKGQPVGLHYTRLTAVLIESIKELKSRITELEKRN